MRTITFVTLVCSSLVAASALSGAFADSTMMSAPSPTSISSQIYCCTPGALTATTNYNYQNHGQARYNDQDCQVAQSGNYGDYHQGYPTAVMSAIFMDSGNQGSYNTGVKCTTLNPVQNCAWVAMSSCPSYSSPSPPSPIP